MTQVTFRAPVRPSGRGGGHLVEVPPDVVAQLGGKGRIPVRATFGGVPYPGSIVRMGGSAVLGVQKAIMAEAGVLAGDTLTVVVTNDDAPREVEVPEELAKALRRHPRAARVFDHLPYSHRREYVGYIIEAKRPETRARRVERTIKLLIAEASSKDR
jgi:antitoxin component of MazEF toxin-antitoxin module